uniref:Macaca fascicularis brain cDNA, clone: QtrA-17830 n=1 Tax=Macaca fascicularis TaxID=9541 RepID=I7GJF6_MACFA|nr:unnamed protein product [Macaca fascicularis]
MVFLFCNVNCWKLLYSHRLGKLNCLYKYLCTTLYQIFCNNLCFITIYVLIILSDFCLYHLYNYMVVK